MKRDKHYQEPEAAVDATQAYGYTPFTQRLGAADQFSMQQPIPKLPGWYMTFWQGNQVPGPFMSNAPTAAQNYRYFEQHPVQRASGAFGGGWMGAVSTFAFLEKLRSAWASQSGYNG